MLYRSTNRVEGAKTASHELRSLVVIFAVIFFINTPTAYLESLFYPYIFDKIDVWASLYDKEAVAFENYGEMAKSRVVVEQFESSASLSTANRLFSSLALTNSAHKVELIEISRFRKAYSPLSQKFDLFYYSSENPDVPFVNNTPPDLRTYHKTQQNNDYGSGRVNLIYPVTDNRSPKSLLGVISVTINNEHYAFSSFERVFHVSEGGLILEGKTPYPLSSEGWDEELWIELEKASKYHDSGFVEYRDDIILYSKVHTHSPGKQAFLVYFINPTETLLYHLPQAITIIFCIILVAVYFYYEFYKHSRRLEDKANIDELSGLHNRAYYNQMKGKFVSSDYYIGILDIDFFKDVNDTYGHDVGDTIIKKVARSIKEGIRERDYAFRVGGEEFVIVLNSESYDHAAIGFERVRQSVYHASSKPRVTASLGFTRIKSSADRAFKIADKQLYNAKNEGRNQSQGVA